VLSIWSLFAATGNTSYLDKGVDNPIYHDAQSIPPAPKARLVTGTGGVTSLDNL